MTKGKCSFVVEIDAEENRGLVEDLEKNFFDESSWEYQDQKQVGSLHRSGELVS